MWSYYLQKVCKRLERQALDLDSLNQARKEIEQDMKLEALEICRNLTALSDELPMGIALFQPDWHQGVLGIVASRIKDQYHRPVIAFAQDQEGILKGLRVQLKACICAMY